MVPDTPVTFTFAAAFTTTSPSSFAACRPVTATIAPATTETLPNAPEADNQLHLHRRLH